MGLPKSERGLLALGSVRPAFYETAFCHSKWCLIKIEKGGEVSTLFVPNLTINLTYLCYGSSKIRVLGQIKKYFMSHCGFLSLELGKNLVSTGVNLGFACGFFLKEGIVLNKKAEQWLRLFPKSYHELNLLMLW